MQELLLKEISKTCLVIQVDMASMSSEISHLRKDVDYHIKRTDILEKDMTKFRGFFTISGWVLTVIVLSVTLVGRINGLF